MMRAASLAFRGSCRTKAGTAVSLRAASTRATVTGAFRKKAKVEGVTVVASAKAAKRALQELKRLKERPHAWDTETTEVALGRTGGHVPQSPVSHGRVVCATCFCGDDADFGNGPRLFIDNSGPAEGLLEKYFKGYFEEEAAQKVFHNYSFERHVLARHGIRLRGLHADTLHLARLYDTSLASWEGAVQSRLGREGARAAKAKGRLREGSGSDAIAKGGPKTVMGVRLGGAALERRLWANTSGLHTVTCNEQNPPFATFLGQRSAALPEEPSASQVDSLLRLEGLKEACAHEDGDSSPTLPLSGLTRKGYGLKSLAAHFGLAGVNGLERPASFAERFGVHTTAAQEAHDSPERFAGWVDYATTDAVLTFQLFDRLHRELQQRPWNSPLHERPIEEVLRDSRVAQELLNGSARTYSSVQFETGKTMWDFFELYIRDFAECLADLEEVGIGVDCDALQRIEVQASRDEETCHQDFVDCFSSLKNTRGEALYPDADLINIRSSSQLRLLLFGGVRNRHDADQELDRVKYFPVSSGQGSASSAATAGAALKRRRQFELRSLELQPTAKRKDFSESGWPKTSAEVLRRLAGNPEKGLEGEAYLQLVGKGVAPEQAARVSKGLLQLSTATRIKATVTGFARPLQQHGGGTGRIHPSWLFDTATGRLACRSPNLQNLPAVMQDRYRVRAAFLPAPGKVFVIADYSQLELRVLAHVANCSSMIEKLSRGGDYHSEVAAEMFPHVRHAVQQGQAVINSDDVRFEGQQTVKSLFAAERSKAKAVNFGIVYGKSSSSLAEDLGISPSEGEQLVEAWHRTKPEVQKWADRVKRDSADKKRSLSLLGRWRNLPLLDKAAEPKYRFRSERAAVNFGIQGSSADIVLAAMLRLWRHEGLARIGFRVVLQIHDEFVLEGPDEHGEEARDIVREVMMEPFKERSPSFRFRVPLTVDVALSRSLGDRA